MKKKLLPICFVFVSSFANAAEFVPERPDAPDNATSIGKGEIYFESELVSVQNNGDQSDYTLIQPTIRYGITDHHEILLNQGGVNKVPGEKVTYKDYFPRFRWNHIGNEGGDVEFSTIYGVNLPTEKESTTDWLVYFGLPFAYNITDDYYFANTISFSEGRDREAREHYNYITHAWALYRVISDSVEIFI